MLHWASVTDADFDGAQGTSEAADLTDAARYFRAAGDHDAISIRHVRCCRGPQGHADGGLGRIERRLEDQLQA